MHLTRYLRGVDKILNKKKKKKKKKKHVLNVYLNTCLLLTECNNLIKQWNKTIWPFSEICHVLMYVHFRFEFLDSRGIFDEFVSIYYIAAFFGVFLMSRINDFHRRLQLYIIKYYIHYKLIKTVESESLHEACLMSTFAFLHMLSQ